MSLLQGPSPKQLEMIQQELGEGPGDIERGVQDLQALCAATPHLPQPELLKRSFLELFVRGCRMENERARNKLESFFVLRARHHDLFTQRSLTEQPLAEVTRFIDIVPLPRLTDEGFRVTIFRIKPDYPESSSDVALAVRAVLLVCDARMRDEGAISGDIFIWDVSAVRGSIVGRVAAAFGAVRRGIHLAHAAYPQRLKRNHIVGPPSFFASSLQLMRSCMNEKVKRRFYLHSKKEELLELIPSRVLPVEFGGEEESLDLLARKWRHHVDDMRDYIRQLNDMCVAPTQTTRTENELYGTVGAFRKLEID